jgi:hypothetical protein
VLEVSQEQAATAGFVINIAKLREYLIRGQGTAGQASSGTQGDVLAVETLRLAWREARLPEQAMTREWWNELAKLAGEDASDIVLNLPGNIRAELTQGILVVERTPLS